MPKRITILDPNGVEVAEGTDRTSGVKVGQVGERDEVVRREVWNDAVSNVCDDLRDLLKHENPKLGTYTVTVQEGD